jgi:hypothetical protein
VGHLICVRVYFGSAFLTPVVVHIQSIIPVLVYMDDAPGPAVIVDEKYQRPTTLWKLLDRITIELEESDHVKLVD